MVFWQIYWSFFKIGALTFGGGYAMLPMIEREIVENRGWAERQDVIDVFAVAQSLPGAIALNSASQIGFRRKGVTGGIIAVLGAVTPSIIIITLIATVLSLVWGNAVLTSAFSGIAVAVCAMILNTVVKFFKSSVIDAVCFIIFFAVLAMALLLRLSPFIYILASIAAGIVIGLIKKVGKKQKIESDDTGGDKADAKGDEE